MVKPPAYKLPHLLALLPRSGRSAMVRPVDWPENSFYKVTRTQLRFREHEDEMKSHGHAWGVLFWKGKLVPPRLGAPAPKIRGGLKHLWREVPADSISPALKQTVAEGEKVVAEMEKTAADALAIRRRANIDKINATIKAKEDARTARLEEAHRND